MTGKATVITTRETASVGCVIHKKNGDLIADLICINIIAGKNSKMMWRGLPHHVEIGPYRKLYLETKMNTRMNVMFYRILTVAFLAMSVSMGAFAQAASTPTELADQITAAKTKTDHEAIASVFDKQSETDKAMAERHLSMAKTYTTAPWTKGGNAAMVTHCKNLAKSYKAAAANNAEMAKMHRAIGAKLS